MAGASGGRRHRPAQALAAAPCGWGRVPAAQALAPWLAQASSDIVIVDSTVAHEQADLQAIEAMIEPAEA